MNRILIAGALALVAGCGRGSAPGQRAAAAAAPQPAATAAPATAPPSVAPAQSLLDLSGAGSQFTPAFTVAGPWNLAWSYDCTSMGHDRNFTIGIENGGGLRPTAFLTGVSRLGQREAGTVANQAVGTFTLDISIDQPCTWHVAVEGPPGPPPPTPRAPALLEASGSGKGTTGDFVATGPWNLFWSYDCTALGHGRNVGIAPQSLTGSDPRGDPVIQLGEKESGLARYQGAGTFHLAVDIDPQCTWRVTVSD